jgi:hypothetical protein
VQAEAEAQDATDDENENEQGEGRRENGEKKTSSSAYYQLPPKEEDDEAHSLKIPILVLLCHLSRPLFRSFPCLLLFASVRSLFSSLIAFSFFFSLESNEEAC